ncbi:MAG: hypothetical protein ABI905_03495 [Betaproteobacteria bacterium]
MPQTSRPPAIEPALATPGSLTLVDEPAITLTPAQRTFKRLVEEIEKIENRQQELGGLLDTFRSQFAAKLNPLQDERDTIHRALVLFLDQQLLRDGWPELDRNTMRDVLCKMAELLFGGKYHDEMEALFDRHSDVSLADRAAGQKRELAEDLEAAFGVDVNTVAEDATPEEMLREALRQLEAEDAAGEQAANVRAALKNSKRKSARVREEEKQALDAGNLLKQIYRKLTSALHPDREADPAERLRKTALMTEVNKAYADGNLLKLLHLQWQVLKMDSRAAGEMADDKLKVINQTLAQQRDELKKECRELEVMIRERFHLPPTGALTSASLQKALKAQAANARIGNGNLRHDLTSIRHRRAEFRTWLGVQREWLDEEDSLDAFLDAQTRR